MIISIITFLVKIICLYNDGNEIQTSCSNVTNTFSTVLPILNKNCASVIAEIKNLNIVLHIYSHGNIYDSTYINAKI